MRECEWRDETAEKWRRTTCYSESGAWEALWLSPAQIRLGGQIPAWKDNVARSAFNIQKHTRATLEHSTGLKIFLVDYLEKTYGFPRFFSGHRSSSVILANLVFASTTKVTRGQGPSDLLLPDKKPVLSHKPSSSRCLQDLGFNSLARIVG